MSTRKTSKKRAPKKAAAKQATRTKATAKKATAKKATAKAAARTQAPVKQARVKKAAAKKATAKKATAKPAARKPAARKGASTKAAGQSPLLDEVEALAKMMEKHGLLEVSYAVEADGTKELHVSRSGSGQVALAAPAPVAAAAPVAVAAAAAPASAAPAAPAAPAAEEGLHAFLSPMVGTFYRSPSPESAPFSSVGDNVDPSSVVCIIEAMKVMNEITPDLAGEIVSIEVENGEAVEFGQTLMLLRPR